jgi:hypothetical protein
VCDFILPSGALTLAGAGARVYPAFLEHVRRHGRENNDLSKSERNESGVLYASRREAPENFDAFRLVLQPQSFSAVILAQAR